MCKRSSIEHRTIYTLAKLVASGAKTCLACLTVKSAMTVMKAIRTHTHTHTTPVSLASPSPQSSAGFPPPKKPTDHHLPNPSPEPEPPAPNPNRSVSSGAGAASGSTCFFSPSEYMDNKCIASLRRPARCGTPGTVCLPPLKKCRRGVVRRRKTLGGLERYFETYSGCSIKTRSSSRSHFQSRSLDPNCGS